MDDPIVSASPHQVSGVLHGETILLSSTTNQYYGLDMIGSRIWELIQEPKRVSDLCSRLAAEFDVDPEVCQRDVQELIRQMAAATGNLGRVAMSASSLVRLSASGFLRLLETAVAVMSIRVALLLWPYDRLRRYLDRPYRVSARRSPAAEIVQYVSTVRRRFPNDTCLTRALAAEVLLRWHGHSACLRIGVAKDPSNNLHAHAWVESGVRS